MRLRRVRKLISPSAITFFLVCATLLGRAEISRATGTYLNFNDFPVTTGSVPGNSTNWEYSSSVTNNYGYAESASAGWKTKVKLSDGWNWFFEFNRNGQCDSHMYVDTFSYMTIVSTGHTGNALSDNVTGGLADQNGGSCGAPLGTRLYNRESYTGPGQVYTGGKVGHSYIYFKKVDVIGSMRDASPYSMATDANRLSAYIYLPPSTTNGPGGYNNAVQQTYQAGIFRDPTSTGYHHYINYFVRGGGWAKIQVEETTNGDNGGNGATRYIPGFLHSVYQFYLTTLPYAGIAVPPYSVKLDDIAFDNDTYTPQNNQTISNMAILYNDSSKTFEISFNDKYKNDYAFGTWELRYSRSPITNENWSSATPAVILPDSRFYIQSATNGRFQKWWPYYQGVWAPFTLSSADNTALAPGQTIYFAVKDVSQTAGNLMVPTDGTNGYWKTRQGGRAYDTQGGSFDWANDQAALPLIKRISYTLASGKQPSPPVLNKPQ